MTLFVGMISCEKELDMKVPDAEVKPVIEGYIENDKYPYVVITKNIDYFSSINSEKLIEALIISDATVSVTNPEGITDTLKYGLCLDSPFLVGYVGSKFKGKIGSSYRLNITYNGKNYNATTSIPPTFDVDSIWFANQDLTDTTAPLRVIMKDNPSTTDYYQFLVRVINRNRLIDPYWVNTTPIAFNDAVFSGQTFNYEIFRAYPNSIIGALYEDEIKQDEFYRMTFVWGDTVFIKLCSIDYNSYQYWSNLSYGSNPFLIPSPPYSNIQGNQALGIWCGRSYILKTFIIPKWKYPK